MRWHSRVGQRVWHAFVAAGDRPVTTGELVQRCWPLRQDLRVLHIRA
jgi:hypothetical protein